MARSIFDRIGRRPPGQDDNASEDRNGQRLTIRITKVTNPHDDGESRENNRGGTEGRGPITLTPTPGYGTRTDSQTPPEPQHIQELEEENQRLRALLATRDVADEARRLDETLEELTRQNGEKEARIAELRTSLERQDGEIGSLENADERGKARLESLRRLYEKPDDEFREAVAAILGRYDDLCGCCRETAEEMEKDAKQLAEMKGSEFADPEALKALEGEYEKLKGALLELQRKLSKLGESAGRAGDRRTNNLYQNETPPDGGEKDEPEKEKPEKKLEDGTDE